MSITRLVKRLVAGDDGISIPEQPTGIIETDGIVKWSRKEPEPDEWIRRSEVQTAIERAVGGAEASPVFTRNERRAVRQIALFLQQTLGLPTTYGS